jgi:hypothetical protein
MSRRSLPMRGAPRTSTLCPYIPGEEAGDRHQRRMETAVEMEDRARHECEDRGLSLVTHANGSHWQVKDGKRIVAQWWPQSGRFVPGERYDRASKAHDIEQMLWRLGKVLAEEA